MPALGARAVRIAEYDVYGAGVFLVRPDGYIGWTGETADSLAEYAARFRALA